MLLVSQPLFILQRLLTEKIKNKKGGGGIPIPKWHIYPLLIIFSGHELFFVCYIVTFFLFAYLFLFFSILTSGLLFCTESIQFSSVSQSCLNLCDPIDCSTPGLPVHHQPPESTQIHVHWVGDAIQPSHPLLSFSPSAFNLSQHRGLFQRDSYLHQVAKVLEFSFSISPSNEHSGLISFRMDWLDLLAVQGILKSLLQHHSSKASVLQCSAIFIVRLSHPYMTTGKTVVWPDRPLLAK